MNSIPAFLKTLREKLGFTQEKFAETFGIPYSSLVNWEQGKRMPNRASYMYLLMIERCPEEAVAIAAGVIEEPDGGMRHVHITVSEAKKLFPLPNQTNVQDAAKGNVNAIRHIAYAEGYADGVAARKSLQILAEEHTGSLTYKDALAKMPTGWILWGNYGDGKWRAGPGHQQNHIEPTENIEDAVRQARSIAEGTK